MTFSPFVRVLLKLIFHLCSFFSILYIMYPPWHIVIHTLYNPLNMILSGTQNSVLYLQRQTISTGLLVLMLIFKLHSTNNTNLQYKICFLIICVGYRN
jgi:hypothetical protein